jgi:AraC-like DNA-binding protein
LAVDPLSDVLALLRPQSSISAGLNAGGEWAIRFGPPDGIKFNAVMRGACWISVEGDGGPRRIEEGDCFLLTGGRPFTFATNLSLKPIEASTIYDKATDGIATCNGGGDFFLIGGRFGFAGEHSDILTRALPPVIHVRQATGQASVLRWALDQLAAELRERRPGGFLISEHLAHIMLVQVLRLYLSDKDERGVGWLRALADRQIGAAIGAMHGDPAHRWTLQELARLAGMSRSSFAHRFAEIVGTPPLAYLARWRILLAGDQLSKSRETIASIAIGLGYESESAFSTAFKREMACSPREYRRGSAERSGAVGLASTAS